jgi:hypothetical protein
MKSTINLNRGKNVIMLAVVFLFISFVSFAGAKINFTGEWTLNETKTNLGEFNMNIVGSKIVIDQKDSVILFTRHTTDFNGESQKIEEKYTLNGKECVNTVMNSPKKSVVKWSDDGKNLIITSTIKFNRDGEEMEIKSTEIYKLADDGSSISVDYNSTSSFGELKQAYVYDKAK